jgi:hypothetical protein
MLDNNPLYIIGAYGRNGKSFNYLYECWENGLDFYMQNNQYGYCSIRDKENILKEYTSIILLNKNGSDKLTIAIR